MFFYHHAQITLTDSLAAEHDGDNLLLFFISQEEDEDLQKSNECSILEGTCEEKISPFINTLSTVDENRTLYEFSTGAYPRNVFKGTQVVAAVFIDTNSDGTYTTGEPLADIELSWDDDIECDKETTQKCFDLNFAF